jgi:hypothetical protein
MQKKMHRKTKELLKAFKRAIEATPNKPTTVIAKELGVSAQTLYTLKHTHMQSERRTIARKEYGVTKVHSVAEHNPADYAVFANPATTRAVLHAKLNQEHEALTKDYVELHDQHLALKKRFDDVQKEAYRFQVETFDLKAIVKYLEGKAGQE